MTPIMRWAGFVLIACSTPSQWPQATLRRALPRPPGLFGLPRSNGNSVNPQWPTLAGQGAA